MLKNFNTVKPDLNYSRKLKTNHVECNNNIPFISPIYAMDNKENNTDEVEKDLSIEIDMGLQSNFIHNTIDENSPILTNNNYNNQYD